MKICSSLFASSILLGSSFALADISYAHRTEVSGAGAMSSFASEAETLTQISGMNSRVDTEMQMKSKLASLLGGAGNTASVVRIDDELTIKLLPDKKQYSVMTFEQTRQELARVHEAMENASGTGEQGGAALPISTENSERTEGEVEVENLKGREKIVGIKTNHYLIHLNQSCTVPDTGKTCHLTWEMEAWLARKVPAEKEVRLFQKAYAEALGLDDGKLKLQGPGQSMVAMFADNWDEVVGEFEMMRGYPLRTIMQMKIGGKECTTDSGKSIAMDGIWADASTAAYNSAIDQAGSEAGSAIGDSVSDSLGDSVGGSIGGAAVGGAAKELIGGFSGMFKKKKKKSKPAVDPADKQVSVFRIKMEVTKWSEISIPKERFEEPANWTKL